MAQLVQMRMPPASTQSKLPPASTQSKSPPASTQSKSPSVCLAPARLVICAVAILLALLSITIASHVVGLGVRSPNPIRQLVGIYAGFLFISAAWDILQLGRQTLASDE